MTENESLRSIRRAPSLRVSADGSEIVIRRAGKELLLPASVWSAIAWVNGYMWAGRPD